MHHLPHFPTVSYFYCQTKISLMVYSRKGKNVFLHNVQNVFPSTGLFHDVLHQNHSLVYKHKHMLKKELHISNPKTCTVFFLLNAFLKGYKRLA